MSTGTEIIQAALQEIGASSVLSPPSPESIEVGLRALNSMMEMWESRNILTGAMPLEVPGDELNEPPDTTNGIINNLAIKLSPKFDNGKQIVSADLRNLAREEFALIKSLYQVLVTPDKVVSSTTPVGQGNERYFRARNFFRRGQTIQN